MLNQRGKRWYRCGLLRRDMAATCSEQGGHGLVWQDPCTGLCDVEFCFVTDLVWRLQDELSVPLHRSPHALNPRVEMSTCCQMCRPVDRWNGGVCLCLKFR